MKKISKEHIAIIQLRDALSLYYNKSYISAITLAGASEEILGKLSKEKNSTTALEIESFLFRTTFPSMNYQAERNKLRNELKHKYPGNNNTDYENFKATAETHLSAAIINLKLFTGTIPSEEKLIMKYCLERGIS